MFIQRNGIEIILEKINLLKDNQETLFSLLKIIRSCFINNK